MHSNRGTYWAIYYVFLLYKLIASRLFKFTYIKSKLLKLPKFRNYIAIKETIGEAASAKKTCSIRTGWFYLPTSQLTCLPLIFNSPLRQCKSELTTSASWEHLSSKRRPSPSSRPNAGGFHYQFTVTLHCITARDHAEYLYDTTCIFTCIVATS